jgi:hypothetical protein
MATSLVNNKYRITRRIGGGSFGEIYLGVGPSGEKVKNEKLYLSTIIMKITNNKYVIHNIHL